jgi:predicted lipid-binding transport protein (Tim44 family)
MDDFLDLPTLIAIAVAVFVLFRLRSVLGTRTGNERPPVDRSRSTRTEKPAEAAEETVVPLRPLSRTSMTSVAPARSKPKLNRPRPAMPTWRPV